MYANRRLGTNPDTPQGGHHMISEERGGGKARKWSVAGKTWRVWLNDGSDAAQRGGCFSDAWDPVFWFCYGCFGFNWWVGFYILLFMLSFYGETFGCCVWDEWFLYFVELEGWSLRNLWIEKIFLLLWKLLKKEWWRKC